MLGGAATAWPLACSSPSGCGRIVFMSLAADDKQAQARVAAFLQGLQELGRTDGRNVRIDIRWGADDADRTTRRNYLRWAPDVILASGGSIVAPLLHATSTVPIVFMLTPDPVGAGLVESLARPDARILGLPQC
jgi:putative ABC transport system substrate-binding protein